MTVRVCVRACEDRPGDSCSPRSTTSSSAVMSLIANIVGFSLFGLAARVGQLGIQKRPIFDSASSITLPCSAD